MFRNSKPRYMSDTATTSVTSRIATLRESVGAA